MSFIDKPYDPNPTFDSLSIKDAQFDVRSYGAIGDGTNDDTAEIQAAIDAAEAAGGGKVFFPAGIYLISTTLTINSSGVTLEGITWGEDVAKNTGTVLKTTGNTWAITVAGCRGTQIRNFFIYNMDGPVVGGAITITAASLFTTIENIWIDSVVYGINVSASHQTFISNVHMTNLNGGYGFNFVGVDADNMTHVVMVRDCIIHNDGGNADTNACIIDSYAQTIHLTDVEFSTDLNLGVWIQNSLTANDANLPKFLHFINVSLENCVHAFYLAEGEETYIINSVVHNSTNAGISVAEAFGGSAGRLLVSNCRFSSCGAQGIILVGATTCVDTAISNCVISGCTGNGIDIGAATSYFSLVGNVVRGNGDYGIVINTGASDYYTIVGNTIEDHGVLNLYDNGTGLNRTVEGNSGSTGDSGHAMTAIVDLTAVNIKALAATPITLVAAPGAEQILEFVSAILILDYGPGQYDDAAADGNMVIRYTDGAGMIVSEEIEGDNFIDAGVDRVTNAIPKKDAVGTAAGSKGQALVLHNNGAEYTTGTGVMRVIVTYKLLVALGL